MTKIVLSIYEYMKSHKAVRIALLVLSTIAMTTLTLTENYKEDISDFLPADKQEMDAMKIFQETSGAGNIYAIIQHRDTSNKDEQEIANAIDDYIQEIKKEDKDHNIRNIRDRIDYNEIQEKTELAYKNVATIATAKDIEEIERKLEDSAFIEKRLKEAKQTLMMPTSGMLSDNIGRDPLNLLTPIVMRTQSSGQQMSFEIYDGRIFSPDMRKAFIEIESPYGANETEMNGQLIELLENSAKEIEKKHKEIEIHLTGAPAIAVGNAKQIKKDSTIAITIAIVLIVALLTYVFRSLWNISLIMIAIAWGWIMAMGGIAIIEDSVSIIVIGISSVIIGIAVNYPLHYISHLNHTPNRKQALKELVTPLVVGNITTVGAFMALVPLNSIALRDLGLFASLLLISTIVFVMIFLPHMTKEAAEARKTVIDKIGEANIESKRWIVWAVAAMTIALAVFASRTGFDENMAHINYMTDEQKEDMSYFSQMIKNETGKKAIYITSTAKTIDEALEKSEKTQKVIDRMIEDKTIDEKNTCTQIIASKKEEQKRIEAWNNFTDKNGERIAKQLDEAAKKEGFAEGVFDEFKKTITTKHIKEDEEWEKAKKDMMRQYIVEDKDGATVVDIVKTSAENKEKAEEQLQKTGIQNFDIEKTNGKIADNLQKDFNYIGWVCSAIVFLFLWLSMGSLELAAISFLPMAISWIWILGIMGITGMQFNIVNVILATFIFGQGDDYTIFMTEGAIYEYAYRKKMLSSYKHSITISALIMFIGIGTLAISKHPALRSLGEVTIVGMLSVVIMSYIFPPLIFKWLTRNGKEYRKRPIQTVPLMRGIWWRATGKIAGVKIEIKNEEGIDLSNANIITNIENEAQKKALRRILNIKKEKKHGEETLVAAHGITEVMPDDAICVFKGKITIEVMKKGDTVNETANELIREKYETIAKETEDEEYWKPIVIDRYRYKGAEVYREVKKKLKTHNAYKGETITDCGYGETALLYALCHKDINIKATDNDKDKIEIAKHAAEGLTDNIRFE